MPIRMAAILLAMSAAAYAQGTASPAALRATSVLENPTVGITKLHMAPGARESLHTHPYPTLVVLLSRGEIETQNGSDHRKAPCKAGDVEYIAAGTPHFAANVGATPLDAVVIALKNDRPPGGLVRPAQSLPGLSHALLVDNDHFAVTRLEFEPEVREPLHTHAYDLVVVPLTAGPLDLQVADKKNVRNYAVGEAAFVPRGAPHAAANIGSATLRLLGVAIK